MKIVARGKRTRPIYNKVGSAAITFSFGLVFGVFGAGACNFDLSQTVLLFAKMEEAGHKI